MIILAKNWNDYSDERLVDFVARFYFSQQHNSLLTDRTIGLMPYMIKENWLVIYQTTDGIKYFDPDG
jgi:acyl carrier protein phosphodiesterase